MNLRPPGRGPRGAPRSRLHWARLGCAGLLVVTALSHALQVALGAGSGGRHVLFVGVNCALALLLWVRPGWSVAPTALLALQQAVSHGTALLSSIRDPASAFDWTSLGVLVFFPTLLVVLVAERRTALGRE